MDMDSSQHVTYQLDRGRRVCMSSKGNEEAEKGEAKAVEKQDDKDDNYEVDYNQAGMR